MGNTLGPLLDVSSAATLLGQSEKWIRKRVERRQIPFRKVGARVLFATQDLQNFLKALPGTTVQEALERLRAAE
jgi:excisionase family DNA binding protein